MRLPHQFLLTFSGFLRGKGSDRRAHRRRGQFPPHRERNRKPCAYM